MDVEGWFFETDHERIGPIALAELQWLVRAGILGRETRVWAQGMNEPARADRLPLLFQPPAQSFGPSLAAPGQLGRAVIAFALFLAFAIALGFGAHWYLAR